MQATKLNLFHTNLGRALAELRATNFSLEINAGVVRDAYCAVPDRVCTVNVLLTGVVLPVGGVRRVDPNLTARVLVAKNARRDVDDNVVKVGRVQETVAFEEHVVNSVGVFRVAHTRRAKHQCKIEANVVLEVEHAQHGNAGAERVTSDCHLADVERLGILLEGLEHVRSSLLVCLLVAIKDLGTRKRLGDDFLVGIDEEEIEVVND